MKLFIIFNFKIKIKRHWIYKYLLKVKQFNLIVCTHNLAILKLAYFKWFFFLAVVSLNIRISYYYC